jgi:type IV pilus assembly protein PilA
LTTRIRKSLNQKDKGFTLIELLVVIIIIGILAAVAIPIFLNQRKKAVDASMKSDARSIATQMETAFTDNQTYPASIDVSGQELTIGEETVILSPNNVAGVFVDAPNAAFCVELRNTKGSRDHVYMSDAGGLQDDTVVDCDTAVYTTTALDFPAA